jgi:hypothetical protein
MLQAAVGTRVSILTSVAAFERFCCADGFNVGPDTIIQAAKFGLLSGDDPTTLNLDALQL